MVGENDEFFEVMQREIMFHRPTFIYSISRIAYLANFFVLNNRKVYARIKLRELAVNNVPLD